MTPLATPCCPTMLPPTSPSAQTPLSAFYPSHGRARGSRGALHLKAVRYSTSPMGGSTPPVHATFTLYPTPGPPPTWHQGGGRGYSHCLGTPDTAPTLSPPPALTPLTSALHGGAGGRCGPPPGALTPQEPAPLEAPCQVPFCSLPEGPRGCPGAVPLREPRSLERSSHCHSDAGRCRAQRGRCRRPAACRCRGECPGGDGWCFRKGVHTCPKVQISLTPQSHPMGVQSLTTLCSSHNITSGLWKSMGMGRESWEISPMPWEAKAKAEASL